jgi:flagellar protein FliS
MSLFFGNLYMRNVYGNAVKTYGQVSYDSAAEYGSPVDLLNLLFMGLTDALIDAQRFLSQKKYTEKGLAVSKSQTILITLRHTLDFDVGGELAINLDDLYAYCIKRLAEAHIQNDAVALREVHSLMSELRDAWLQASRSVA